MKSLLTWSRYAATASRAAALPRAVKVTWRKFMPVVGLLGVLSACEAEDDADYKSPSAPARQKHSCQVSVAPSYFEYVVDGDILRIMENGYEDEFERVASGDPSKPVFGIWNISTQENWPVGTVRLDLKIEPGKVTAIGDCDFGTASATAEASSRAEITDYSVRLFDYDEDIEYVYTD